MTKHYTRRGFLVSAGAAGVGAVLAGGTGALAAPRRASGLANRSNNQAVAALTRSEFAPLVGSKFRMKDGAASQGVVLESVGDLSGPRSEGKFALLFRGPKAGAWSQGTYTLSHRSIGQASLLVVPVDRGVKGRRYQVIVNRA